MSSEVDISVKVKLKEGAHLPYYATGDAAGADLYACCSTTLIVPAGGRALIPTGVFLGLPPNFEAQVRPRSGLALKSGITVLNTPGTVDADYRGEIGVILFNTTDDPFHVKHGDRIAQLVVAPVIRVDFDVVEELDATSRGTKGFGSTGK